MQTTRVRVTFTDADGYNIPGPIFEMRSTSKLAEIQMIEMWPGTGEPCGEDENDKDGWKQGAYNADEA